MLLSLGAISDPVASLSALFGATDPLARASEQLAKSSDPRGRSTLLRAISDRFESSVLLEPPSSASLYAFPTRLGSSLGSISIIGARAPLTDTQRFLRPFTPLGTIESPLSLGDLVNLAA
ncbi:MAG: hypothetical protein AB7K52_08430 [Phycisphaerales bacterium]